MISVVTCTNKDDCSPAIIDNYVRQKFSKKELILILNNDKLHIDWWINRMKDLPNVKIEQLDEQVTLGECLNYAIKLAKYDYIAKMDDDDYYAEDYLTDSLQTLKKSHAQVVGKTTIYMYFEDNNSLQLFNPYKWAPSEYQCSENRYNPKVLMGGTLFFEKSVNNIVPFQSCNIGEDVKLCEDCIKHNIPIYSGMKDHYVYIRRKKHDHTWKVNDQNLKKYCTHVTTTSDFRSYLSEKKKPT